MRSRLSGKLEEAQIWLRSRLSPPEQQAFVPQQAGTALPNLVTALPSATQTAVPTATPPASTPLPSPTPTVTPTPLPASVAIQGVKYQDQHGLWNYCAPSNLAMALSFWGIDVDRTVVGKAVKPNQYDKNVMPYEMADYVAGQTELSSVVRAGGDLDLLRRFTAAGLPVLVEKGAWIKDFTGVVSWMGHYQVVTGYDDVRQVIIAQDSYYSPDYEVSLRRLRARLALVQLHLPGGLPARAGSRCHGPAGALGRRERQLPACRRDRLERDLRIGEGATSSSPGTTAAPAW